MSDKENNLPDYIDFLYDRFFKTRIEFLIFTQNEQESKVLRVIEYCIELERAQLYKEAKARTPQGQKVEIPEIVWTPISHRFVMDQLFGTIQSETTVKEIFASLEKKHFIFRGPGAGGPYDAPIYTINKHLMAELAKLLPSSIDDLDMAAIMKKPREVKKVREGQKLTPSIIDPLVIKIRETINAPLDPQLLALYSPIIAPLSRSRGGQKLPPKRYKETTKEIKDESDSANGQQSTTASFAHATDATPSLSQMTNDDLLAELAKRGLSIQPSVPDVETTKQAVLPIASISTQEATTQSTEQEQTDNGSGNSEQSVTSATEKPAGKGRGGNRKSRAKKNDIEVEPAPPPAAPDESMPWNVKKALAWADHFRGYDYPESNHTNSKYQRAVKACQTVIKRNISEKNFVYVFKYMKGVNPDFCSTFWADKDVEVWTVNEHFDEQVKEIRKRRPSATAEQQQPTKPKVMSIQEVAAMGRMKMAQTPYKPFNLAAGGQ